MTTIIRLCLKKCSDRKRGDIDTGVPKINGLLQSLLEPFLTTCRQRSREMSLHLKGNTDQKLFKGKTDTAKIHPSASLVQNNSSPLRLY